MALGKFRHHLFAFLFCLSVFGEANQKVFAQACVGALDGCNIALDGSAGSLNGATCQIYLDGSNPCYTANHVFPAGAFCLASISYAPYTFTQTICTCAGTDGTRPWRDASATAGCTNFYPTPMVTGCCKDPKASNYQASCAAGTDAAPVGADKYRGFCTYPPAVCGLTTGTVAAGGICDDGFECSATTSTAYDTKGCASGTKCTCASGNYVGCGGPMQVPCAVNPTCQVDAACATVNPVLAITPQTYAFGSITVGSTTPALASAPVFTINNTGSAAATGCTVSLTDNTNFLLTGSCASVAANSSCSVQVQARPTAVGAFSTNLTISCSNSVSATTTPNGISENGSALPTAVLSFGTLGFPFGSVILGTSTSGPPLNLTQTITISNASGNQTATGCNVSLTGNDFTLGGVFTGLTIPSPGSVSFTLLDGTPPVVNGTGIKMTQLAVSCSGPGGGSATTTPNGFTLNAQTWPALTISPPNNTATPLNVPAGPSAPPASTSILVTNTGTLTASTCSLIYSNNPSGAFSSSDFSTNCSTISGSGSCSFSLQATPPAGITATYTTDITVKCTNTTDSHYNANSYSFATTAGPFVINATNTTVPCPGMYSSGSTATTCPSGYELTATFTEGACACRPILPNAEFFRNTTAFSDGYPVCGTGRTPVTNSYVALDLASAGKPNMDPTVNYNFATTGYTYGYSKNGGGAAPNPVYGYSLNNGNPMSHCACTGTLPALTPGTGIPLSTTCATCSNSTGATNKDRFVSDLASIISGRTSNGPVVEYSAVPIPMAYSVTAKNNAMNGYLGAFYSTAGSVACACPNLNETMVNIDTSGTTISGTYCKPSLDLTDGTTNTYKILTSYNPADATQTAQIISSGGNMDKTSVIKLPTGSGSYQNYNRRIWSCAPPMELDIATKKCKFVQANHACDDGAVTSKVSVVSSKVGGGSATAKFQAAVNKKLACCMNAFNPSSPNSFLKFDCVDNSANAYGNDFDTLWASSDAAGDGGQPNAIALSNSAGQLVTGFYTLKGERCGEFSEFKGTITAAKVNQAIVSSQQSLANNSTSTTGIEYGTYTIAKPAAISADAKWSNFLTSKRIPATADEMRRCPILARAAMKVTCPTAIPMPSATASSTYTTAGVTHCTAASLVQVHLRVEQIYEIAGLPKIKTVDSVSDSTQGIGSVSVSDMISGKTQGICPSGATYQSDGTCAYQ